MESISTIRCLIRPRVYMAKLDINDAYYSIPILGEQHRNY